MHDIRDAGAEGAEHRAEVEGVDRRQAELLGDEGAEHRAIAAEREHRRVGALQAGFGECRLNEFGHHRDRFVADGDRRDIRRHRQRLADAALDCSARFLDIQPSPAAEEGIGVEVAEHEQRVGQCCLAAAETVAGRAGRRAHAFRSERDVAVLRSGDRAAADGGRAQHRERRLHRNAHEFAAALEHRLAVPDHRGFRRRAADIEADDVLEPVLARNESASERAEHRAGFDRVDRLGLADARDAAAGVADQQRTVPGVVVAQQVLGLEQRAGQVVVRVGVHQREVRARLVMADLRHLAAEQHRHRADDVVRILIFDEPFDRALGLIVREGALQTHADATHAGFEQDLDRAEHLGAIRVFGQPNDTVLGHEFVDDRRGAVAVEIALVALGDQQADLRATALGEHIGGDRRRPADQADLPQEFADIAVRVFLRGLGQAAQERDGVVVRSRVDLERMTPCAVGDERIGHGSAGIDIYREHRTLLFSQSRWPARFFCCGRTIGRRRVNKESGRTPKLLKTTRTAPQHRKHRGTDGYTRTA